MTWGIESIQFCYHCQSKIVSVPLPFPCHKQSQLLSCQLSTQFLIIRDIQPKKDKLKKTESTEKQALLIRNGLLIMISQAMHLASLIKQQQKS